MNPLESIDRADMQALVWLLLAMVAWWRGGAPERACASILLGMAVVDRLYHAIFDQGVSLASVDTWHFSLDIGVFVAFLFVSLKANRLYPLLLAAFQLVAINAHLVRGLVDLVSPIAYFFLYVGPSYFQTLVMLVGLALHVRRLGKYGPYRDWRVGQRPA